MQPSHLASPGDSWSLRAPISGRVHRLHVGYVEQLFCEATAGERIVALVTDPPYSSGGRSSVERAATPLKKYKQTETKVAYDNFEGDQRDQRSWRAWCYEWLAEVYRRAEPRAYCMCFVDWRQLPSMTDAVQMAGWLWRGLAVWDKTLSCRPQPGHFRAQAEFVVWGSKGPLPQREPGDYAIRPGVMSVGNEVGKVHLTQKPQAICQWLCSIVPQGEGVIVDPFGGSCAVALGAEAAGHRSISIEASPAIASKALSRLATLAWALERTEVRD
ncbi:MAG TPA: DNA methyltransferase [Thermoanaerobaculia bacterium]|nr:DNA methyltransferase [Thermoanaerobaculia bacterium]